ncbi:MAG: DUF4892 domain-containing protein, partial [Arenimonas sp.]
LLLLLPLTVMADASQPTQDEPGSRDLSFMKRYEGSFIVNYEQKAFDQIRFPLSPLRLVPGRSDAMNNYFIDAKLSKVVEGRYTRLLYVAPEGRSAVEVLRNYMDEIRAKGGKAIYGCNGTACGGDMHGNDHGGGTQGLLEKLYPHERLKTPNFSNGNCASTMDVNEQRFVVYRVPSENGDIYLAVYIYNVQDDLYCKAFNDRTMAMIIAIEPKAREQKMVTVSAAEMQQAINSSGRIALYGIYFDTNKTDIKPESDAAIEQIAALLKANANLKVFIVGHTDNVGSNTANMDLSKRRANAVMGDLASRHGVNAAQMESAGIGMLSPLASNDDEAGRSKNRRVELVKR